MKDSTTVTVMSALHDINDEDLKNRMKNLSPRMQVRYVLYKINSEKNY